MSKKHLELMGCGQPGAGPKPTRGDRGSGLGAIDSLSERLLFG